MGRYKAGYHNKGNTTPGPRPKLLPHFSAVHIKAVLIFNISVNYINSEYLFVVSSDIQCPPPLPVPHKKTIKYEIIVLKIRRLRLIMRREGINTEPRHWDRGKLLKLINVLVKEYRKFYKLHRKPEDIKSNTL